MVKEVDQSTYSGRIAAKIRKLRERKGWTVQELFDHVRSADSSGVVRSFEQFKHWERGKRPINLNALPAIASVFGTSVSKLIQGIE